MFIVDTTARTRPYVPEIRRVIEEDEEISFKAGSHIRQPTEKEQRSFAIEQSLRTAVDIEPQLIPPLGVAVLPVGAPVSTVTGVVPLRRRSFPLSKTPSKRKSTRPKRVNLRTKLVRDLRKRKRELSKELGEVKRDLKSLRAK